MANTPDGELESYECKVVRVSCALFDVQSLPTNAFYFVIKVQNKIAQYYFPHGSNVREFYSNWHELPYFTKQVVVKFDAIMEHVGAAFNPICVALGEADIPTFDHPQLIANIASDAAMLAQELGSPENGTVPILVEITREFIQIIDINEDEDEDEWEENEDGDMLPLTESSIVALAKVTLDKNGGECPICLEEMAVDTEVTILPCNHIFHGGCIANWLRLKNVCPVCRFRIPSDN